MKITIKGIIIAALPIEQGISKRTGNQWNKEVVIIETLTNPNYQNRVAVSLLKDELISKIMTFPTGSAVEVDAFIESRNSQSGRWFTDLTAVDIRPMMTMQQQAVPHHPTNEQKFIQQLQQPFQQQQQTENYDITELPF